MFIKLSPGKNYGHAYAILGYMDGKYRSPNLNNCYGQPGANLLWLSGVWQEGLASDKTWRNPEGMGAIQSRPGNWNLAFWLWGSSLILLAPILCCIHLRPFREQNVGEPRSRFLFSQKKQASISMIQVRHAKQYEEGSPEEHKSTKMLQS